jgi:hypothetical protein
MKYIEKYGCRTTIHFEKREKGRERVGSQSVKAKLRYNTN